MVSVADIPADANVYEPRGGARQLFHCRDLEVDLEGPAGTGKSRAALEKANAVAEKYPGARILLIRKTRVSMTESVLVTWEEKVLGPEHYLCRNGATRAHRTEYRYKNGSVVVPGGMDNPDRIMSTEWDLIIEFEATELSEHEHEMLSTRLRNGRIGYHQQISDCNPSGPGHWINRRALDGKMTRILSRHKDNPFLWDGKDWTDVGRAYMATLERLTGHRKNRLLLGKWTAAEGLVYPEFEAAAGGHVIDAMPDGWQGWPKRRSIDLGFNDPFVCQWWAESDDALYLYREVYMSGRIIEDHARQILRLSAGEDYEATVSDHDREDRETLHRHGVQTTPATKDIDAGIAEVKARLTKGGNGKPRLFFLRSALVERDEALADAKRPTSTLEEFDAYLWKQHRDGVAKDEPVDRDNHGMDAMRYCVMSMQSGQYYAFGTGTGEQPKRGGWREAV